MPYPEHRRFHLWVLAWALLATLIGCRFDQSGMGVPEHCGNGAIDGYEECDGAQLDGRTCLDLGFDGGDLYCSPFCDFDMTGCTLDTCGNGQLDPGESCDGLDLNGRDCTDAGYDGGTLQCATNCAFDASLCFLDTCGDSIRDPAEECDGADLGGLTCADLGYYGGALTCSPTCHFLLNACEAAGRCGDGAVQSAHEECDGVFLAGETCESLDYYGGTLACDGQCHFDLSSCGQQGWCGDTILQSAHEECDGDELGGKTCQDLGYYYEGDPDCTGSCQLDTAPCEAEGWCGDGVVQTEHEDCDGQVPGGHDCTDEGFVSGDLDCNGCALDTSACVLRSFGDPCLTDENCDTGVCLTEGQAGMPHGLCSEDCNGVLCTHDAVCVHIQGPGIDRCFPACTSTSGCRAGYSCFNPWESLHGPACLPDCDQNGDCGSGNCNAWTGLCNRPVTGAHNGEACTQENDCRGHICQQGPEWPGGYCTSPCALSKGTCPADSDCVDTSGGLWLDMGLCLDECSSSTDCRENESYSCLPDPHGSGQTLCIHNP